MANTTSGTTTFDKTFSIDEIIEESYNRLGQFDMSGYNLKTARRSLNIMFQEWGNRGLHYWEVGEADINLVEGQSEYIFVSVYIFVYFVLLILLVIYILHPTGIIIVKVF